MCCNSSIPEECVLTTNCQSSHLRQLRIQSINLPVLIPAHGVLQGAMLTGGNGSNIGTVLRQRQQSQIKRQRLISFLNKALELYDNVCQEDNHNSNQYENCTLNGTNNFTNVYNEYNDGY
jgi:hypothetical protein